MTLEQTKELADLFMEARQAIKDSGGFLGRCAAIYGELCEKAIDVGFSYEDGKRFIELAGKALFVFRDDAWDEPIYEEARRLFNGIFICMSYELL